MGSWGPSVSSRSCGSGLLVEAELPRRCFSECECDLVRVCLCETGGLDIEMGDTAKFMLNPLRLDPGAAPEFDLVEDGGPESDDWGLDTSLCFRGDGVRSIFTACLDQ